MATDSLIAGQQIEFLFFFIVNSGRWMLWITDMLSPLIHIGPIIDTHIIRSLYINPRINSIATFMEMNSAPKTDVSIVDRFLEYHDTSAMFMNIKIPFLHLLVILSSLWSESTKILRSTSLPRVLGVFPGIASLAEE